MEKGVVLILVLVGVLVVLLFVPIPFRHGPVSCLPCPPDTPSSQCPKCPQEGDIGWGPSLASQIISQLAGRQRQQAIQATPSPTPPPQPTPQPSPDPTANWKTFANNDIYFKYPSEWNLSYPVISSTSPKVRLVIVPKDGTLMNECMKQISEEVKDDLTIKRFERVTTGEMCSTSDSTPREIWVVPFKDVYSPGISYEYSVLESEQAKRIFTQILSTFKFLK